MICYESATPVTEDMRNHLAWLALYLGGDDNEETRAARASLQRLLALTLEVQNMELAQFAASEAEHEVVPAREHSAPDAKVIDLFDALKRSLEGANT